MAELKKRILTLDSGKTIKLWGNSLAIGKSLEIAEAYAPNIFFYAVTQNGDKATPVVSNPHGLTRDELLELADYSIRLWMDFKDAIRKHGINNVKVFIKEGII
ncbi:hypothetical protein FXV77_05160 [Sphingobacterium phlebotomi]|uniref:Uncharacterized protein n=1 Tax=Sphingobacterium phlebotomi TaxID=2605433 RepID=A0A5D4H9U8_9SPHI|nr:hypothetical protein [Sphingobacterium phlebotomi]TYR37397.1 hypothetical protein FXV77_05160 [Sphingobacterium phlebotomi]